MKEAVESLADFPALQELVRSLGLEEQEVYAIASIPTPEDGPQTQREMLEAAREVLPLEALETIEYYRTLPVPRGCVGRFLVVTHDGRYLVGDLVEEERPRA